MTLLEARFRSARCCMRGKGRHFSCPGDAKEMFNVGRDWDSTRVERRGPGLIGCGSGTHCQPGQPPVHPAFVEPAISGT